MNLKSIIKNIFNCCFHSPAKDVAAKGYFSDSISVEVDWPSLFELVNQKGRRAFFVPFDQIQHRKDLCENCISSVFSNDIDFASRGWFCWWRCWDNRGEYESPVNYPTGKGLHSSCKLFSAVLRDE